MRSERRGIEAAGDIDLILSFRRRRRLAVKEARDMAELLRLGNSQLLNAGLGNNLTEQIVHAAACASCTEKIILKLVPITRETEECDGGTARTRASVIVADKGLRKLNRAILTIVGVHYDIAVLHAGIVANNIARDVLVGHRSIIRRFTSLVLALDGFFNGIYALADAINNARISRVGKSILLSAIHTVVATHGSTDDGITD